MPDAFWNSEREASLEQLSQDEGMNIWATKHLISEYWFLVKEPLCEEAFEVKSQLLER